MRYFAIGLKGWVEVRRASAPPRRHDSKTETVIKRRVARYDRNFRRIEDEERPTKLTINVTRYTGGRLVKTYKDKSFARRMGIALEYGAMVELMPEQVEKMKITKRALTKGAR